MCMAHVKVIFPHVFGCESHVKQVIIIVPAIREDDSLRLFCALISVIKAISTPIMNHKDDRVGHLISGMPQECRAS